MADDNTPSPIAEISHEPSKFDQFLDQHQKKLIILAVLAVVGLLVTIAYQGSLKLDQQDAGSALFNAKTAQDYSTVIQEQSSEETKATASLLLAREQAKTDTTAAVTTLEKLVSSYPTSAIANDAKLNLGLLQLETGKTDKGLQNLEALKSDKAAGATQVIATYALAEEAMKNNDRVKAQELFDQASKMAANSNLKNNILDFKKIASVIPPTRIQPRVTEKEEAAPSLPEIKK